MSDGREEVCDGEEEEIEGVMVSVKFQRRMMLGGSYEKQFIENCTVEAPYPSFHLSKQSSFKSSTVCHIVDAHQ